MKILLLIDSLHRGGRERRMMELIKGLVQEKGVEVELVIFSDEIHYEEVFDLGVKIHQLIRKPKKDPRIFSRFYKLCKAFKPDVLHSWGTMTSIYAIPAAKLLGIKLLSGHIADAPKDMGFFDERLFRSRVTFPFSQMIVGNSKAGLRAYGAPTAKSHCVYNGFDFNRISELTDELEIREKFNILTPKVVGMVGAFFDRKDFYTYIKAALKVTEEREDVSFLAIGGGENREACMNMVPDDKKDRIIFTGSQSDIESIVNVFDIGVLATNTDVHGEGISNSILEYMVLKKPVVATTGGGTNEIVLHEQTGFLVANKSPDEMATRIMYLLDHPAIAKDMGEMGRTRVYESFNLATMTDTYMDLYKKLIGITNGIYTDKLPY